MKKVVMFFVFVCFISLALASFNVTNISIENNYPLNQILRGEMNINVSNMDSDVRLTSNKGHDVLFLDLLKNNSALYSCVPDDCENGYEMGSEVSSLSRDLVPGDNLFWGFVLRGVNVNIKDVSYALFSDFDSGTKVPLIMNIFEGGENWVYKEYGNDVREIRYGNDYDEAYGIIGPIISDTVYCSEFWIYETNMVRVGFDYELNNATGELKASIYNKDGEFVADEDFNPSVSGLNTVDLSASDARLFSSGSYYVCVGSSGRTGDDYAACNYKLYEDVSSGDYSSFSYSGLDFNYSAAIFPNKTKNYGIFLQEAMYDDASGLGNVNFSISTNDANLLVTSKYGNDCSNGCVFPVNVVPGVEQRFNVDNVIISYSTDGGNYVENNISELEVSIAKMFFSSNNTLDLGALGFVMNESGNFKLYLDGDEILSETVKITSAPIIKGIYPSIVPAGISALLFADISYDNSSSLSYEWDFGDSSSQTVLTSKVYHLFRNISEYNVKLTVKTGNLSNFMTVKVNAINPRDYVGIIYDQMSLNLNQSISDIESFPVWQQKILTSTLDIPTAEDDLSRLGRKISEAIDDEDYLEIAGLLNTLDIPKSVFVSEIFTSNVLLVESMDIDAISEYTGESLDDDNEKYVDAIALWQDEEVEASVVYKKVSLLKTSGVVQDLFLTYFVTLESDFSDDSFFVINKPHESLTFNNILKEPRTYGTSSFMPLGEGSISYEFFVLGSEGVEFFASPMLRDLVLRPEITDDCNFNNICEEGESPSTCRSDCKPMSMMIIYILLAFIFGLILYTGIQVWYMRYYEKTLFKEKHRLHNLLMFVTSAKTSGKSEVQIRDMLEKKGWTKERIDYVIKKVKGERTGLYEVIPISKISAYLRKRKVIKKRVGVQPISGQPMSLSVGNRRPVGNKRDSRGIATSSKQQMRRNINKDNRQNLKRGK